MKKKKKKKELVSRKWKQTDPGPKDKLCMKQSR